MRRLTGTLVPVAALNPELQPRRARPAPVWVITAVIVAFALFGSTLRGVVYDSTALSTAGTVFAGIFVQALPFLALGVTLSALLATFVVPHYRGVNVARYHWPAVCSARAPWALLL
jgi:hypothetical protein